MSTTVIAQSLCGADGRVCVDLPCATCQYNLRTLVPDGRCPECGTAVADTIASEPLHLLGPAALKRAAAGVLVATLGVALVALVTLNALLELVNPAILVMGYALALPGLGLALAAIVMSLIGVIAFTAPVALTGPRAAAADYDRKLARMSACVGLTLLPRGLALAALGGLGAAAVAWVVISGATLISSLRYLRGFCARGDRPARWTLLGAQAATIGTVVTAVLVAAAEGLRNPPPSSDRPIMLAFFGVALLALLLTVVVGGRAYVVLRRTARAAKMLRAGLAEAFDSRHLGGARP